MVTLAAANVASFVSVKLGRDVNNRYNYETWSEQMLCLLQSQDLMEFIDDTPPPPENRDGAWRRNDWLIKGWILGALSDEVIKTVVKLRCARAMWLKLKYNFSETRLPPPSPPPPPPFATVSYKGKEWREDTALYRSALRGDWQTAKRFVDQDPNAIKLRLGFSSETAIHVAATVRKPEFLSKLLDLISDDSVLALRDKFGDNPLHTAAAMGNYQAAEILVTRYPNLLYHSNIDNRFPHHSAADFGHREILQLFISKTYDNLPTNPFAGDGGCVLLELMICADFFDIALELVNKYPYMVTVNPKTICTVLVNIAEKATVFCIDDQLSFWKRLIYWYTELPWWHKLVLKLHPGGVIKYLASRFNKYHEKIMLREKALKLVKCLCKHMESLDYDTASRICQDTILAAAETGNRDVVEEIVEIFPLAIYFTDSSYQSFIHLAVKNRCEKVFNLLYQSRTYDYSNKIDNSGNSILHLAACLAPTHKLNLVSGAALQMQREIQWFQEASKFLSPHIKEQKNSSGETAKMIFTKEHKRLKIEGEKWMKDTASSCTIAATLIATVVFAAAITVPGGNKPDSGYPVFHNSTAFTVFAVSDAVSLFTSSTSLLMFLSIHTSRYAEEDFLYALPKRLCIGLFTLFVSILFMMIAFSSTVYLVFGRKKAWVLFPMGALTCLPISSFVLLQYPLLRDVISSTYGRGIFGKQSDRPFP
ncbi:hypothetical protein SASPL_110173 [Salvia splendens]|uniref:PGG domain-containing protein n=1 Tax=Salvia splendens TaxID=180675 RepID=A0A8X8Y8E2_SALSN|nr:uncharacterized protein LOC121799420 isoform X2 [Salvia splendens]KAG6425962.1 hypothetical protein SASPL_110173 [Salvia splendens]